MCVCVVVKKKKDVFECFSQHKMSSLVDLGEHLNALIPVEDCGWLQQSLVHACQFEDFSIE